ncbi:MAG: hypothetical protein AcusKO_42700 [Acuticoccus sp.]
MVGTGRGAGIGVLFRKGEALQTLRSADIVALDKTGTLTKGRPELTDIATAEGFGEEEVLTLVAAVEAQSEHPIAEAIGAAATARELEPLKASNFSASPGFGVAARVSGTPGRGRRRPLYGPARAGCAPVRRDGRAARP